MGKNEKRGRKKNHHWKHGSLPGHTGIALVNLVCLMHKCALLRCAENIAKRVPSPVIHSLFGGTSHVVKRRMDVNMDCCQRALFPTEEDESAPWRSITHSLARSLTHSHNNLTLARLSIGFLWTRLQCHRLLEFQNDVRTPRRGHASASPPSSCKSCTADGDCGSLRGRGGSVGLANKQSLLPAECVVMLTAFLNSKLVYHLIFAASETTWMTMHKQEY